MSHFPRPIRRLRSLGAAAVIVSLCTGVMIAPTRSGAATAAGEVGAQLLQAQLQNGASLPQATCEQLTRAVSLATHAHRHDATTILAAALTRKIRENSRLVAAKPPCDQVVRLLHASVAAAPEVAASLIELASSLCPDCADALQSATELFNDKNVVDDKNGPTAIAPPADPTSADTRDSSGLDGLISDDPEIRNMGIFAGGFGPGFPGSPGFVGSAPGGGIALPPPVSHPVTPVMNE